MINEKSTKRYTDSLEANHNLVTKSFLKKFAEKSKNVFRAEQINCDNYNYLLIITDVPVQQQDFELCKFIIDVKDSKDYDTTITWNISADEDTGKQKSSVNVLCKGVSKPVYTCKYQKNEDSTAYYAFVIEVASEVFVTVDVSKLGEKKNNLEDWYIYPSNNIEFEKAEEYTYLKTSVKDAKYLLKGDGTETVPYEEDLKYLDFEETSLEEYNELGKTAYDEKLYVKGTIPTQIYFKSNNQVLQLSPEEIQVSGMKFVLINCIYYKTDLDNDLPEELIDTSSFTGHLKVSEACLKYKSFKPIEDFTKTYDDLNDIEETSDKTCLISENSNNSLEGVSGVFTATRALIAKEADHSKESDHSKETGKFLESKTISFPTENNAFITFGESTTSDFEDEIILPTVEFKGVTPKSTVSLESPRTNTIHDEGEWFNNIFIRPGDKGLIYRVCKTTSNAALPYINDLAELYFRIDDSQSIDTGIPFIDDLEVGILKSATLQGDELDVEFTDKSVCVFYDENKSAYPLIFKLSNEDNFIYTQNTIQTPTNIIYNLENPPSEYSKIELILWQVGSDGVPGNNNVFLAITPKDYDSFDGTIDIDNTRYGYKWINLSGINGALKNNTNKLFDSTRATFDQQYPVYDIKAHTFDYPTVFKSTFNVEQMGVLSDKKIIVLGSDGLLIKKGTKEFKFQI